MKQQSSIKFPKSPRDDLNLNIPRTSKAYIPANSVYALRSAMKQLACGSAVLAVVSLSITSYENELYFKNNSRGTYFTDLLRCSVLCISMCQMALIYAYYQKKLEFKKAYKEISRRSRVWEDPLLFRLYMLEVLLNSICVPPFISTSFTAEQLNTSQTLSTDDVLYMVGFLKLYHLGKLLHELSGLNSERARMYCHLLNEEPDALFTIKGIVKGSPFLCISALSVLLLLILGIILRVCERNIPNSKFSMYWNGFWLIGVTKTSVGYGEIHPLSHLGRVFCFLAALFGIFLHSYAVLIINRKLLFSKTQLHFYVQVKLTKRNYRALKNEAAMLIQKWWRKRYAIGIEKFQLFCECIDIANDFSRKRREFITQKNQSLQQQIRETSTNALSSLESCVAFLDPCFEIQSKSTAFVREQLSILQKIHFFNRFACSFPIPSSIDGSIYNKSFISERISHRRRRDQALVSHFSKLVTKVTKDPGCLSSLSLASTNRISTMKDFGKDY